MCIRDRFNCVYRAYRVPYDYCPQAGIPEEVAIEPVANEDFRMPGAAPRGPLKVTIIEGTHSMAEVDQDNFCLATDEEEHDLKDDK